MKIGEAGIANLFHLRSQLGPGQWKRPLLEQQSPRDMAENENQFLSRRKAITHF
jgi:hypothetical protein